VFFYACCSFLSLHVVANPEVFGVIAPYIGFVISFHVTISTHIEGFGTNNRQACLAERQRVFAAFI